jgi:integration host factor subunit beta
MSLRQLTNFAPQQFAMSRTFCKFAKNHSPHSAVPRENHYLRLRASSDLTISAYACDFIPGRGQGMIKSELAHRLVGRHPHHLFVKDANRFVDALFEEIEAALVRGDRVELRGFGAFTVRTWPARSARNPRSGAVVSLPKKRYPVFKTGKQMLARLNPTLPS